MVEQDCPMVTRWRRTASVDQTQAPYLLLGQTPHCCFCPLNSLDIARTSWQCGFSSIVCEWNLHIVLRYIHIFNYFKALYFKTPFWTLRLFVKLFLFPNATKFCPTTNLYFSLMGWIEATVLSLAFSTNKKNNFFCVYARIFKIGIDWKDRDNAFWNKQKHLVGRERPYGTAETRPRHSSYYSIDGVREPLPSMTEATSMDRGGTCRKRSLDSFFLLKIKV